jgi:predicted kinase
LALTGRGAVGYRIGLRSNRCLILPAVVICEDEWIDTLGFEIKSHDDFERRASKWRTPIGPLASELLHLGVSVVFDFSGNTVRSRQWVRTIFEKAKADHLLHVIEATDAQCLANIHRQNHEKPPGIYLKRVIRKKSGTRKKSRPVTVTFTKGELR